MIITFHRRCGHLGDFLARRSVRVLIILLFKHEVHSATNNFYIGLQNFRISFFIRVLTIFILLATAFVIADLLAQFFKPKDYQIQAHRFRFIITLKSTVFYFLSMGQC